MGERLEIGFLHHVLGLMAVEHDAPSDPVKTAIVARHDKAQRLFFARQSALREQAFVSPLHLWRYSRRLRAFHPMGLFLPQG